MVNPRYKLDTLHVEYAERRKENDILFIFSLFSEYIHLGYVRIHVIYRVNQAEYGIHIRVVATQEYVNIYSTRRLDSQLSCFYCRPIYGPGPSGINWTLNQSPLRYIGAPLQ